MSELNQWYDGEYYIKEVGEHEIEIRKLDNFINYDTIAENSIVICDGIAYPIIKSSKNNYYINIPPDLIFNKCGVSVKDIMAHFGYARTIIIAPNFKILRDIIDYVNNLYKGKNFTLTNNKPIKQENYVNRLQKSKARIIRGEVPTGSRIRGKVNKTAISVQCLGYSICSR